VPAAVGTAKNAVGIGYADGHRRHIAVGIGGRRHRLSRLHSYRPTTMISHRHSNAAGTGNFSYSLKNEFSEKIKNL
jgi:hypothetical protein